jgi:hypothetical protein
VRCLTECQQAVLAGRESKFADAVSALESNCTSGCNAAYDCVVFVAQCKSGVCRALPAQ